MKSIFVIPTAGACKEVLINGFWWKNFFTWPIFKSRLFLTRYLHELKPETIARLDRTIRTWKPGDLVLVVGGHSPKRAAQRVASSVDLMREYLEVHGVKKVVSSDLPFDTTGFVKILAGIGIGEQAVIVSSWYHRLRIQVDLRRAGISRQAIDFELVYPWCAGEYIYNVIFEPFKLLISLLGVRKFRKREKRLRDID